MNPNTQQPKPLDEKQKKQYNTYRSTGMPPERALSLALQTGDTKYSPLSNEGMDRIIFGKGGLVNEVAGGVADAFTFKGAKEQYEKDKNIFQSTADPSIDPDVGGERARLGQQYADNKKPLTYGSAFGKGIGRAGFAFLETADDLIGESVSGSLAPVLSDAVNSDVGQYLVEKGSEFNERNGGAPGEIVNLLDLFGLTALPRKATAQSLKNTIISNGKRVVDQGIDSTRRAGRLTDYFKTTAPNNPVATQIDEGFKGIEQLITKNATANTDVTGRLDELKAMIRDGNFEDSVLPMLDDFDLTPEDQILFKEYIKNIDEAVNQDGAAEIAEAYLTGTLGQIDSAAAGATNIVERLSDGAIEGVMKTAENVRNVPAAIANRVQGANDRRIVRIATSDQKTALENILELYKTGIVPGVKKKNKTIANINQIDEAVKRLVPELAKKYDVEDIADFAGVISIEKKAIFSQIEEGLEAAGKAKREIDLQSIVDELDKLATTERASFSSPLRKAIERAKSELIVETPDGNIIVKKVSANGAQDLIADLNAALQPQFRGARTNADDVIDFLLVNNLRKLTDDVVDDLGSGSFKDLKAQYADLKKIEDDVVHRAVFEAQKGNGLASSISDVTSAADLAAGAFSPAFLARSAGGFITKEVTKAMNDKDELIRQMFLYGKNVDAPVRTGGSPIKSDDVVEDLADRGTGFGTSPDSEVLKSIGDQDIKADVDFTKPVKISENEIDLFGTKLPLNSIESKLFNDSDFRLQVETMKTRTGRKSPKQPVAFYSPDTGGITFVPRDGWSMARIMQTFYHETGHAIDYKKRMFTKDYGAAGGVREVQDFVRNTGWGIKKTERDALAFERFARMMKPTVESYGVTDDQLMMMFKGKTMVVPGVGYFKPRPALVKYVRAEKEVFAEAYAMYRLNPDKLKELSPRTHEFINEIVSEGKIGNAKTTGGAVEKSIDDVEIEVFRGEGGKEGGKAAAWGDGTYFAESKKVAEKYGNVKGEKIDTSNFYDATGFIEKDIVADFAKELAKKTKQTAKQVLDDIELTMGLFDRSKADYQFLTQNFRPNSKNLIDSYRQAANILNSVLKKRGFKGVIASELEDSIPTDRKIFIRL